MYKKFTLISLANTQVFYMRKILTLHVWFDHQSNLSNQCLFLSYLWWFLSYSQFCDYYRIKSRKTYPSLMLPPGDRNWQLINPNYTFLSKSSLKITYLQKEMYKKLTLICIVNIKFGLLYEKETYIICLIWPPL
jgi:hypothetical protein